LCASDTRKDVTLSPDVIESVEGRDFLKRPSMGVRCSATEVLMYDLMVLTGDVNDAVTSAGGWLCDRVRAGWRVTVFAPQNSDFRPLQILGVHTSSIDDETDFLCNTSAAAIAVAGDVLGTDKRVRDEIRRIVKRGTAEVTFWGDGGSFAADIRFSRVAHRLSCAARTFKAQAAVSASIPASSVSVHEEFRSCAMWYSPEGADLTPTG
jgi:hypothetical protein